MRGLSDLILASRFRSFSQISSVFAIAVGLLTLVGWLADIQVLKSIAPLLPSMKANSALCLALVGLGLLLLQERPSLGATDRPQKDLISRNASIVCAGIVALVACLTFLEYALGWDLRIDQLLFNDAGGPFKMTPAGRMAPATALDYLFLSVALILLTWKSDRAHRASQFLSLAVGVLSLLALVGYVYGAYHTYDLTYHRSMALHEAGALVIFSAAVLFAHPQSGYVLTMTGQGHVGILVRRLLPWAVGVPFLLGWLRLEAERNGIQLTDIEFSLFVVSNMVIFSVLIWASARSLVATEQALLESEERYHSIFDNSDDAILLTVPDGRILAANMAACQMVGRSEEEICQVGRRGLVDSCNPTLPLALEERERTGGFKGELTFVRRNGERFPAEVTSTVFHDSQRNPRTSMIIRDISERKRAEEALRESEEQYRGLVEAAPDVVYTISAEDGSLTSLNPAFERITGWSRAQWLGKPFMGIVHPDDRSAAVETFQKALRGEAPPLYQLRILSKSGEYLVGEFTSTPHVKGGKVVGELGIARDITERKREEEERIRSEKLLRESRDRLELALAGADLGMWDWIIPTNRNIYNTRWAEMLGYSLDELEPSYFTWEELVHPEDRARVVGALKAHVEGKTPTYETEHRLRTKSGEWKWILDRGKVLEWDDQGKPVRAAGTHMDITERKRAEEALAESERKLKTLFEILPVGASVLNAQRMIVYVNPALERILDISKESLFKGDYRSRTYLRPDGTLMPAEEFASVRAIMEQRAVHNVETGVVKEDGKVVWTSVSAVPVAFPDWKVVVVTSDITERKRAEEELKRAKSRLQRLSHRLLEVQENDRRAIARELHDEIGQILTAAKIDLQVVRRGNIPEDLAARLDENIASLDNCLSRVRNLSLDLRPSMLDDLGLVAALRWQLNRQAERAGFQVHLVAEDVPERLRPELETTCYRMVQEALTNIAKHAHAHNVRVELTSSDREVLLSVRDDGVGFHAESALADAAHGVSFGILGMQERASLLGGKLEIVSAREKGTTVTARFPLR